MRETLLKFFFFKKKHITFKLKRRFSVTKRLYNTRSNYKADAFLKRKHLKWLSVVIV